jgi:hypothetical protein
MFMVESVDSLAWECDAMGARANAYAKTGLERGGAESEPINKEIDSTLCDALQRVMDGLVDEVELKCDFIM